MERTAYSQAAAKAAEFSWLRVCARLALCAALAAFVVGQTGPATAVDSGETALAGKTLAGLPPIPKKKELRGRNALIDMADDAATRHGLEPELVHAVILAESRYNPQALSHKGAMGLMQLMPGTAKRYGVGDPWSPPDNIDGGVRYLRDLLKQFGSVELAVAAYNAGEKAVERYGNNIPPYAETEVYVERVKAYHAKLNNGSSVSKLIQRGSGVGGAVRLSGWGVIFGSYVDRSEARDILKSRRGSLKGVMGKGRSAVVKRERENGYRFAALLVGLKQADASAACKRIRSDGAYCKALTPAELKDPRALWR